MATQFTSLLIALVAGFLVAALLFYIFKRSSSSRKDFLLVGLPESGKSAIFMRTVFKKLPQTFTSSSENIGEYRSGRMSCRLIDIPGHYRVRSKYFDQYKRSAKGIIFVVDSVTVHKEIRDVADVLYATLADSATLPCSFLVLCNKQDEPTAKSAQLIKTILEKEMNIARDTRSRKLQSVGEEDEAAKSTYLGKEGRDFEFAHVPQNIQFYECSAKDNELNNLSDWIDRML